MHKPTESRQRKYPFNIGRVFVNAVTAFLSIFFVLIWLNEIILLSYFVIMVFSITFITFFFKLHPVFKKPTESLTTETELKTKPSRWRIFLLLGLLLTVLVSPFLLFLLAKVLPIYSWFILVASFAAGLGISEILFYIYCTKVRQTD
jgi:hypothetical protein